MLLEDVELPRCLKPPNFGNVVKSSLHTFADASEVGYGMCSYLRQVNEKKEIHVALVLAKSRVTPLKIVILPKLELAAATLGAKMHNMLKEELMINDLKQKLWVGSKIVLGYIYCSRGISQKDSTKMNKYFNGPLFLWQEEATWKKKRSSVRTRMTMNSTHYTKI